MTESADDDMKIPPALIKRWMKEFDRLGLEIERLEKRRASVRSLIEAASPFAPVLPLVPPQASAPPELPQKKRIYRGYTRDSKPAPAQAAASAATPHPVLDRGPSKPQKHIPKIRALNRETWFTAIMGILDKADGPVSYSELREGLLHTSFKERLEKNDKVFYTAVMKLRDNKLLVTHKRHLFSPSAFEKFIKAVENNEIPDIQPSSREYRSKLGDGIKAILRKYPNGLESKDIMAELKRIPEFEYAADPSNTSVYNVLKRLIDIGSVDKKDGLYILLESGDDFPLSEASNDQAEFELMADAELLQSTGVRH